MNRLKINFLLTCLTLLLVAMGSAIDGQSGMIIAYLFAGAAMRKLFSTHPPMEQRTAQLQCLAAGHSKEVSCFDGAATSRDAAPMVANHDLNHNCNRIRIHYV